MKRHIFVTLAVTYSVSVSAFSDAHPAERAEPHSMTVRKQNQGKLSIAWPVVKGTLKCAIGLANLVPTERVAECLFAGAGDSRNTNLLMTFGLLGSTGITFESAVTDFKEAYRMYTEGRTE